MLVAVVVVADVFLSFFFFCFLKENLLAAFLGCQAIEKDLWHTSVLYQTQNMWAVIRRGILPYLLGEGDKITNLLKGFILAYSC